MYVFPRYKSLVGIREPPAANGENCVFMLSKLCPLRPGAFHIGVTKVRFSSPSHKRKKTAVSFDWQLCWSVPPTFDICFIIFKWHVCVCEWQMFLKEDIYQLLECKRERTRQLAALTLQRYTRMFFVRKRFVEFRKKFVGLQAQCRGFLTRSDSLLLLVL